MKRIKLIIPVYVLLFIFIHEDFLPAQDLSLHQIQVNLSNNPPNTGDQVLREQSILALDNILKQDSAQTSRKVVEFYHAMLDHMQTEFPASVSSTVIWLVYNHGFVIKTPKVTLAFDLITGYSGTGYHPLFDTLKEQIKLMFVSHFHGDHYGGDLVSTVTSNGGHIFTPSNMAPGDSLTLMGFRIKAYDGLHGIPLRIFEVTTPSGLKIVHTGDNQTSQTLPFIENVDVLLLNAWVNESGSRSAVDGMRNCLYKLNPDLMIPGHIQEMGHDYDPNDIRGRVTYEEAYEVDDIPLDTKIMVMAWGERYQCSDIYDKAYVYSAKAVPPFLPADEDSVLILSEIVNPKNQPISVEATIESNAKDLKETIILRDDGFHHDSVASDGIFGGVWSRPNTETNFNIDISTRNLETGFNNGFHNVARFTTIGPVVFDSYTVTHPFGTMYTLKLSLKNNGLLAKAPNITAILTTPDTAAVTNIVTGDQEPVDIDCGQTVELAQTFSLYTTGSADLIPIDVAILCNGYSYWIDNFVIDLTNSTQIPQDRRSSLKYALAQNYPNPFNPLTTIVYQLPVTCDVELSIYNLLGQKVAILVQGRKAPGHYQVQWDTGGFSSGVYFYRLTAGNYTKTKKLVLQR